MSLEFFLNFVIKPKQVGSVIPSSRFLVEKMVAPIDFEKAEVIVELGPGTGVITKALLEEMKDSAKLYAIEVNPTFVRKLERIADPRLRIVHEDAVTALQKISEADYIVSGLPLTAFPEQQSYAILKAAKNSLKEDGAYIQFQYTLGKRPAVAQAFDKISIELVLLNFPPARIYTCTK